jgi:transposase-like protein
MSNDDLLSRRPRTKRVFSNEDMARLRDLYYDPDVPMLDAADAFGVPVSTLMRWIIEMRWPRKSTGWRPAGMAAKPRPEPVAATEAAPHPNPLPASGERESPGPTAAASPATPLNPGRLAIEVAAQARAELAAMGESGGPLAASLSLAERKRRADIIASLSRSIARIDKSFELKAERKQLKRLIREQQEKISALQNAGLIDVQRAKFALLQEEFEKVKG